MMKRYLSVLALQVRGSIYKVFGMLCAMCVLQLADFYYVLRENQEAIQDAVFPFSFEEVMSDSHMKLIFAIALVGLFVVLMWSMMEKGKVKTKRFLWRLSVDRRPLLFMFAGYQIMCFAALTAVQIGLVVGMYLMYREAGGGAGASQALMMAFYRNGFLHGLLPLSDGFRTMRLIIMIVTWGMASTYIGYTNLEEKYRKISFAVFYVGLWFGITLLLGIENLFLEVFLIGAGIICIAGIAASLLGILGEVHYEG